MDFDQGAFGYEFQIERFQQPLKKKNGETLQPESQPHSLEFLFAVGSVHRRNSGGNMPFNIMFRITTFLWGFYGAKPVNFEQPSAGRLSLEHFRQRLIEGTLPACDPPRFVQKNQGRHAQDAIARCDRPLFIEQQAVG